MGLKLWLPVVKCVRNAANSTHSPDGEVHHSPYPNKEGFTHLQQLDSGVIIPKVMAMPRVHQDVVQKQEFCLGVSTCMSVCKYHKGVPSVYLLSIAFC